MTTFDWYCGAIPDDDGASSSVRNQGGLRVCCGWPMAGSSCVLGLAADGESGWALGMRDLIIRGVRSVSGVRRGIQRRLIGRRGVSTGS